MNHKLNDINEQLERVNAMIDLHKSNPSNFMLDQYIMIRERLLSEKFKIIEQFGDK